MNCISCGNEIRRDLDIFGTLQAPKCWTCWIEEGDEFIEDDNLYFNLGPDQINLVGKIRICKVCAGTGVLGEKKRECFRCKGTKYLVGAICTVCNGTGETDHLCDCEFCDTAYEVYSCSQGITWTSYKPKPWEIERLNQKTLMTP